MGKKLTLNDFVQRANIFHKLNEIIKKIGNDIQLDTEIILFFGVNVV